MELCSGDGACTYLEDPVDGSRVPPYWRKVAAMRVCLAQQATRCDACLYIDTDAVLNVRRWRGLMDVRRLLGEGHFAFAPDMISVPNRLNAGVFAARNSSRAAAILDSWWFALPRDAWTREEPSGTWRCRDDEGGSSGGEQTASMQAPQAGDCLFAGRRYEQGVFNREVLHAYEDDLHEVSPVVWNNYNNRACDAGRIKHFMGVFGTWMDTSSAAPFDPERDGKQNRIAEYLEVCVRNTSAAFREHAEVPPGEQSPSGAAADVDHTAAGMQLAESGDLGGALDAFRAAVAATPGAEWVWDNLASCLGERFLPDRVHDESNAELSRSFRAVAERMRRSGAPPSDAEIAAARGRAHWGGEEWARVLARLRKERTPKRRPPHTSRTKGSKEEL